MTPEEKEAKEIIVMIKLMIGNWVSWKGVNYTVSAISELGVSLKNETDLVAFVNYDEIELIPLTEERLEQLDFDRDDFRLSLDKRGVCKLEMRWTSDDKLDECMIVQYLHYLHEWQNIYFTLTGVELTIKKLL